MRVVGRASPATTSQTRLILARACSRSVIRAVAGAARPQKSQAALRSQFLKMSKSTGHGSAQSPRTRSRSASAGGAAEQEAADGSDAPPVPGTQHPTLMWINEFTKFGVSAAAFGTLVYYHNAAASFALSGSIANSVAGKILKRVLNIPRPGSAPKADPGMPSSHALSLAYLSTYACAAVLSAHPADTAGYPLAVASAVSLQGIGLFLTWLRVHLGYHTVDQVAVGYGLGVFDALLLYNVGQTTLLPALREWPELEAVLYGFTMLSIGLFALAASKWVREAAGRLGLRMPGSKKKSSSR